MVTLPLFFFLFSFFLFFFFFLAGGVRCANTIIQSEQPNGDFMERVWLELVLSAWLSTADSFAAAMF